MTNIPRLPKYCEWMRKEKKIPDMLIKNDFVLSDFR